MKDKILKNFVVFLIVILCLFGLCAGVAAALDNTEKQLENKHADTVNEADVIEFFNEKISALSVYY